MGARDLMVLGKLGLGHRALDSWALDNWAPDRAQLSGAQFATF